MFPLIVYTSFHTVLHSINQLNNLRNLNTPILTLEPVLRLFFLYQIQQTLVLPLKSTLKTSLCTPTNNPRTPGNLPMTIQHLDIAPLHIRVQRSSLHLLHAETLQRALFILITQRPIQELTHSATHLLLIQPSPQPTRITIIMKISPQEELLTLLNIKTRSRTHNFIDSCCKINFPLRQTLT